MTIILVVLAFFTIFFLLPAKKQDGGKEITPPADTGSTSTAQEAVTATTTESGSTLPDFDWNWELLQSNPLLSYFTEYLGEFFGPIIFWSVVAILLVIILSGPYNAILSYGNKAKNVTVYKWDGVKGLVEILKFLFIASLLIGGGRAVMNYFENGIRTAGEKQLSPRMGLLQTNQFQYRLDSNNPKGENLAILPNDEIRGLLHQGKGGRWYNCISSPSHPEVKFTVARTMTNNEVIVLTEASKIDLIRRNMHEQNEKRVKRGRTQMRENDPPSLENLDRILYSPTIYQDQWDTKGVDIRDVIFFMTNNSLMYEAISVYDTLVFSRSGSPCEQHAR